MMKQYDFKASERQYKAYWERLNLYGTGDDPAKPDYYILDFFPYPSGEGLSVGHCRNYVPTCVDARFHRMNGYNVLHPMGWDAFGLPAENYAIEHGIHPQETTQKFCANYKRQMKLIECSYDWSREINSTDPDYYRWTQWFFLLLFKRGLAYQAIGSQWWCPQCQTILANEQVENGRCWRCGSLVEKKELKQWYFKITAYAERLLADLDTIEWPEHIKTMQRNWIGHSEGAEIIFRAQTSEVLETSEVYNIPVFTTRPDTLYGATFLVLAPEHPLVGQITTAEQRTAVNAYIAEAKRKSEMDRQTAEREKTGIFTGAYASHPLTGAAIPIWIADYVLMGYGTGAIMAVPAHDGRDYAFARKYDLPIIQVIETDGEDVTAWGTMINSGPFSGLSSEVGGAKVVAELAAQGRGRKEVSYKIRDWLISRQRYWGAPIPIVHCPNCGPVAVPEAELPVRLPDTQDFAPMGDGRSPLARIAEWVNSSCPQCGGPAKRETDTMDGFACSSWYFLRFPNPDYTEGPFDPEAVARWLPVDTYVGGAEHAVLHLLYARFWTKVMYDAGLVSFTEPFATLKNQGVLSSPLDGRRMSKSRGNVITPDEVVARHGVDALRAYVLFLGPFEAEVTWDDEGIVGVTRFLRRYWKLANEGSEQVSVNSEQVSVSSNQSPVSQSQVSRFERRRHQVIQQMTHDMAQFRFNTAVATMMSYLNDLAAFQNEAIPASQWHQAIESFTLLLAPICPFITEAVWQGVLGHTDSVHQQAWPTFTADMAAEEEITVVVQVNGRLRERLMMAADVTEEMMREAAVHSPSVQNYINGQSIRKVIVVPGKLVNIVV
jgi:leucyl-tRNA synthetase